MTKEETNNNFLNLVDLEQAERYYKAGFSLVPIGSNKVPRYPHYKNADGSYRHWTWNELKAEWEAAEGGIGINCGYADLRVLDIEDIDYYNWLKAQFPEIMARLPLILTPGGGAHCPYRSKNSDNKRKILARDTEGDVLIETREQGQYVVAPGSCNSCHPSNMPYVSAYLTYDQAPYLSDVEINALHDWCREQNEFEMPDDAPEFFGESKYTDGDPNLPSIRFANAVTWESLLTPLGWVFHHCNQHEQFWTRPGAKTGGVDAVSGLGDRDTFYCYSTSVAGFDVRYAYSKSQFLCATKFDGNWDLTVKYIIENFPTEQERLQQKFEQFEFYEAPEPQPKAKPDVDEPNPDHVGKVQSSYQFSPIDSVKFNATTYNMEWLIRGIMVKHQPALVGGPQKSLKTNIIIDMAISIGTGGLFLGRFQASKMKVCLCSGESGEFTIQETARRICKAKNISLDAAGVYWHFQLPKLSVEEELQELVAGLHRNKIEVLIIDPIYLCLLAGGTTNSASVWEMGEKLKQVVDAAKLSNCQVVLCHHAKKSTDNSSQFQPQDLTDLSGAGIAEFARQWVLVNRRESFKYDGYHKLWMVSGGSVGHGCCWAVDVDEGALDEDDFSGRTWEVAVMTRQEEFDQRSIERTEKKQLNQSEAEEKLLTALDAMHSPPTKTHLMETLGWNRARFNRVLNGLIDSKIVVLQPSTVAVGNGGTRKGEVIVRCK